MSVSGLPFDSIRELLDRLPGPDEAAVDAVRRRNTTLFGEEGAPGRIAEIHEWLAAWSGVSPSVRRPIVALFAGTHGDSPKSDREATAERAARIASGGAPIGQICSVHELGLKLFDLALAVPAGDITGGDALDEKTAAGTIAYGMEAIAGDTDLLCLADCGAGENASAQAIFAAITRTDPERWCIRKGALETVRRALDRHGGQALAPLEILRRLGGREICALAGAILAARIGHVPVILEGPGALAAALVLKAAKADAIDHCMAGQGAGEGAVAAMLNAIGKRPLIDLGMNSGAGEGAALAAGMVKAAAAMHGAPAE